MIKAIQRPPGIDSAHVYARAAARGPREVDAVLRVRRGGATGCRVRDGWREMRACIHDPGHWRASVGSVCFVNKSRWWSGPPISESLAYRWSRVRATLPQRSGAENPTARWPPAPPSTASETPLPGQYCPRSASAVTRQMKIPKGPKKRARTRMTQIQMGLAPTMAATQNPGGATWRLAIATALQGQQTHRRRPPGCAPWNLQTASRSPQPV